MQGTSVKTHKLESLAIMFSEYYFYLATFIDDNVRENFNVINDSFPTIYRIDRIQLLSIFERKFYIPYSNRFEKGSLEREYSLCMEIS